MVQVRGARPVGFECGCGGLIGEGARAKTSIGYLWHGVFLQRVRVRPVGRSGIYELYRLRFRVVPYLSEIQHRRVIEPNGNEVGKLADIAIVPQGQFPAAQWAILSTPSGEKVVRWGDLAQEIGHFRLRNRLETTPDAQLPTEALRLARDLLDKQIVDTHGAKVVRVRVQNGRPTAVEDFVTGWQLANGTRWGRPVWVLNHPDGSLLISDDQGARIYRVSYIR